jgi:hypothetical protein
MHSTTVNIAQPQNQIAIRTSVRLVDLYSLTRPTLLIATGAGKYTILFLIFTPCLIQPDDTLGMGKVASFSGARAIGRSARIDWMHYCYVSLGAGWLTRLSCRHWRFADLADAFSRSQQRPTAQPDCDQRFSSSLRPVHGDPVTGPVVGCRWETDNLIFHLPPPVQGEDTGEGGEVANA